MIFKIVDFCVLTVFFSIVLLLVAGLAYEIIDRTGFIGIVTVSFIGFLLVKQLMKTSNND